MSHGAAMLDDPARVGNFIHTIDRSCRRPAKGEGVQDSPHVARRPLPAGWREGTEARQRPDRRGIPLVRLSEAGVSACGFGGLVHFAGRGIPDFAEFVKGVADGGLRHRVPVNSSTVWRRLGTLHTPGTSGHAIEGATGATEKEIFPWCDSIPRPYR